MRAIITSFVVVTITAILAPPAEAQSFLTNGLVAYYPFNGNANDTSGNGHNGTNHGAVPTADRFGYLNSAYKFDGSSSYIDLSQKRPITGSHTAFSISGWIKPASVSAVRGLYFHRGDYADIGVRIDKGTPTSNPAFNFVTLASSYGGQNAAWVGTSSPIRTNVWASFMATYDGAMKYFFINGVLASSEPYSTALNWDFNFQGEAIGGGFPLQAESFDGVIDDVRVYNRALSGSEVQLLYAYESRSQVCLLKAVKPSFNNLMLATSYQLQISVDNIAWTNQGPPFIATNISMPYSQYWDVDNWSHLFFRLQAVP